MSFNGCLIGNWCIGDCRYNVNNVCTFDPIVEIDELKGELSMNVDDEWLINAIRKLEDEWEDLILYNSYMEV